jgi:hypothetical protein
MKLKISMNIFPLFFNFEAERDINSQKSAESRTQTKYKTKIKNKQGK